MIVVDSSVLVKYFSREPGWEEARSLLLEGPLTVGLAVKEVANALWKKVRAGEMELEVAETITRDLASGSAIRLFSQEELLPEALGLAVELGITVYDALFIALAREKGLRLATSDRRQAEAARRLGVEVVEV